MTTYYVYILANKTKSILNMGFTNDLENKLRELNTESDFNKNSFVQKAKTIYLVYYKQYPTYKFAKEAELILRNKSRLQQDKEIRTMNPNFEVIEFNALV